MIWGSSITELHLLIQQCREYCRLKASLKLCFNINSTSTDVQLCLRQELSRVLHIWWTLLLTTISRASPPSHTYMQHAHIPNLQSFSSHIALGRYFKWSGFRSVADHACLQFLWLQGRCLEWIGFGTWPLPDMLLYMNISLQGWPHQTNGKKRLLKKWKRLNHVIRKQGVSFWGVGGLNRLSPTDCSEVELAYHQPEL